MDNDDNPFAAPPSEQAERLRVLWNEKRRVFMALSMVATLEAEGLNSSYWRGMLELALAEARYQLGRMPGGDGGELLGVGRCWDITAGGKVTPGN
jgi:hypothetical protein